MKPFSSTDFSNKLIRNTWLYGSYQRSLENSTLNVQLVAFVQRVIARDVISSNFISYFLNMFFLVFHFPFLQFLISNTKMVENCRSHVVTVWDSVVTLWLFLTSFNFELSASCVYANNSHRYKLPTNLPSVVAVVFAIVAVTWPCVFQNVQLLLFFMLVVLLLLLMLCNYETPRQNLIELVKPLPF